MQAGAKKSSKASGQAEEVKETKTAKATAQTDTKAEAKKAEVKTAETKKTEAKKAEVKKEEPKKEVKEVKEEAKAAEPVKEAVKEPAPKAAKKTAAKAKKAAKEPVVPELKLQYDDENGAHEADVADITAKIKAAYVAEGHRESSIKALRVYLKPQDQKAYYVINYKIEGNIDLF